MFCFRDNSNPILLKVKEVTRIEYVDPDQSVNEAAGSESFKIDENQGTHLAQHTNIEMQNSSAFLQKDTVGGNQSYSMTQHSQSETLTREQSIEANNSAFLPPIRQAPFKTNSLL